MHTVNKFKISMLCIIFDAFHELGKIGILFQIHTEQWDYRIELKVNIRLCQPHNMYYSTETTDLLIDMYH